MSGPVCRPERQDPQQRRPLRRPEGPPRPRALAAEVPRMVARYGPLGLLGARGLSAHRGLRRAGGWAHWDHVRMPDYRWGVFLTPHAQAATIHVGDETGAPAWDEVPGEHRGGAAADHRHPGRHRARQRRAAAPARAHGAVALRHAQPVPGQRRGGPPPVGDGLSAAQVLRQGRPRRGRGAARAPLGRPRPPADPRRVQPALRPLAVVLLLHHVRRPRRQVPARRPARERLRSAGALLRVHAHRGGVPPVRRRDRHGAHHPARRRARGASTPTATCGARAASTSARCSARSTTGSATASTCSAASCPTTPPATSAPASRAASRRPSATATTWRSPALHLASVEGGRLVEREVPLRTAINEVLRDDYISDCERAVRKWNHMLAELGSPERLRCRTAASTATRASTPGTASTPRASSSRRRSSPPAATSGCCPPATTVSALDHDAGA
jgi:benzoyl-CoA 2,3-dioxygenase component B